VVGAGVAVVDHDGRIVASSRLDDLLAEHASHAVRAGVDDPDVEMYPAGPVALVVARTSYTPVFTAEERGIAASLAIQLQLAMQRIAAYEHEAEARRLAERAQRELEATMYGLAHDLRAPTVAITGFAQLLDETSDPQDRDEMAGHIRAAAEYVDGLVDALLEVSRVGRTQTATEPVDLATLASRVGERLRSVHPRLRVEVDGLPTLRLNPVRAEQLLENLLGNAAKHAGRPDVTVTVTARHEDGEVVLVVADDGQGVPEADRDQVFDLYHRGSHVHPGSGIGLGMVRRIAESYGGTVGLGQEGPGATFLVRLPESVLEPSSA
jgi:signal transduction histidine kinase